MEKQILSASRLRSLLNYDKVTGHFYWRKRSASPRDDIAKVKAWNTKYSGQKAGVKTHGYIRITIDDRKYYAHRLAFLYVLGSLPKGLVDHKNGNGLDNHWNNLQSACKKKNADNPNNKKRKNKTGYTGVIKHTKGRYIAQCTARRKYGLSNYLGIFETAQEAHAAYLAARAKLPR